MTRKVKKVTQLILPNLSSLTLSSGASYLEGGGLATFSAVQHLMTGVLCNRLTVLHSAQCTVLTVLHSAH